MKKIQIGVIGAGGRGEVAHHAHKPAENVYLVAAADIDDKPLKAFKEKFGPEVFLTTDYKELLARHDIDAVFITSPDFLHEEHATAALKAGKHVYLEKPMAISIAGCDRILRVAYENDRKLYLGHNMRHMSFVLKMKELIDQGAIGKVKTAWCRHFISYGGDAYFRDWHADRRLSNSLLLQKAAHDIDVLHWLCNGYTIRTNAMGSLTVYNEVTNRHQGQWPNVIANWKEEHWPPLSQKNLNPIIDVEDISMMNMQLDNGVFACYQQCHFTPDAWRNYTIIGTEGRIENFGDYPECPGQCVIKLWNKRTGYNPCGDVHYCIPREGGSHGGADPKIVAEFIHYLQEGGKITTSAIAARNSVATGCAATESLRNGGKPVEIPSVSDDVAAYFNKDIK
jgi:predicted dehydrogenase